MWLFCDDLKAVFVHTHIAHLLQMCYHSSTHPSHSSICKEELKKSCTITASASRQQSGYEPSPLSQPSVYCWVLCSDECYTYMRTSGMCLYNRVKHTGVWGWNAMKVFAVFFHSLLAFWSIWPSLSPQTTNRPSLTIWCKSSQVFISLLDTKSYPQVPQLLEWPFLIKNQLDSWAKVSSVKLLLDFQKFVQRCPNHICCSDWFPNSVL